MKGLKIYDFWRIPETKRLDRNNAEGFAKLVDISPVYLCDLEKAERARVWKSCKMVSKLALNKEELKGFTTCRFGADGKKSDTERSECFLKDNRVIVSAQNCKDWTPYEEWQDFIDKLRKQEEKP
ncbi:MAG: hypothetical protein ACLTCP_14520 [Ruminococcus bicirculans (ex Wegman et al. 2014)]